MSLNDVNANLAGVRHILDDIEARAADERNADYLTAAVVTHALLRNRQVVDVLEACKLAREVRATLQSGAVGYEV